MHIVFPCFSITITITIAMPRALGQSEPSPAGLAIFEPLWPPTVSHDYMRSHSFD